MWCEESFWGYFNLVVMCQRYVSWCVYVLSFFLPWCPVFIQSFELDHCSQTVGIYHGTKRPLKELEILSSVLGQQGFAVFPTKRWIFFSHFLFCFLNLWRFQLPGGGAEALLLFRSLWCLWAQSLILADTYKLFGYRIWVHFYIS